MIGLTPCLPVSLKSSTAPASEPWSVSATAGISKSAARWASAGMRHAPSRIEYSEWTWRWTKGASGTALTTLTRRQDRTLLGRISEVERHQDRVRVAVVAQVMARAIALPPEADGLVERDRGLVPREHVELELLDAVSPSPLRRRGEQGTADAAATEAAVDHQAEVGHVVRRRMPVAREREAADDPAVELRDQDRGVGVPADRAEIAALFSGAAPLVPDHPALGLAAHRRRQLDEGCG